LFPENLAERSRATRANYWRVITDRSAVSGYVRKRQTPPGLSGDGPGGSVLGMAWLGRSCEVCPSISRRSLAARRGRRGAAHRCKQRQICCPRWIGVTREASFDEAKAYRTDWAHRHLSRHS
jgi:hypothetical protein